MGFRLAAGGKEGVGKCSASEGTRVKEMLTDTINVICLLPQEVDGSLFCSFCTLTFSPPALHALTVREKLEKTAWKEKQPIERNK